MSIANGAYTRTNSYGPDMARVMPRFFIDSVEDQVASAREGRPIFRDEERVEIILPGNPQTRPVQIVTELHKQKWPEQYKAFKAGHEMAVEGCPLEEWPRLKRSQVLELKALGFLTVEQIAVMSDLAIQKIGMGGRQLRELAVAFLDDAERNKLAEQQASMINRQDSEIAALRHQLEEVTRLIAPMHAELQGLKNAPHPLATSIPGMSDPIELAKQGQGAVQQQGAPVASSLSDLTPRKRLAGVKEKT